MSTHSTHVGAAGTEAGWTTDPAIQARAAGEDFSRPESEMERMICEYPAASIVTGFGAGCAVGLILANLFRRATTPRRSSEREHRKAAEQLGQEIFESIARSLPESLCARM